jgi:isopentenyl phosphate kinase
MRSGKHSPQNFYFLKLGGSLITDKARPHTPRPDILARLAGEIKQALAQRPGLQLVVGHGSGSFGHVPGKRYGTRQGVSSPEQWRGFAEVWFEATALTRIVVEAFHEQGLPVIAFSPSGGVISQDGVVLTWDLAPLQAAMQAGLLPVMHGDVVFDRVRGGTILSTEDLFMYLARQLQPERILLAGIEAGVWEDYPTCDKLIPEITPERLPEIFPALGGSSKTDVTGGMSSKVQQSLVLIEEFPDLVIQIFSGDSPSNVKRALLGESVGTTLRHKSQPENEHTGQFP